MAQAVSVIVRAEGHASVVAKLVVIPGASLPIRSGQSDFRKAEKIDTGKPKRGRLGEVDVADLGSIPCPEGKPVLRIFRS